MLQEERLKIVEYKTEWFNNQNELNYIEHLAEGFH